MHFPTATFFTAALAAGSVSAASLPLSRRQGGWWKQDKCHGTIDGTILGGSTLWMLRNTWNNHFGGDFGGGLKGDEVKGVCCWGQCLWVSCRGDHREWNGNQWGQAFERLNRLVGEHKQGLCGARVGEDPYLIMLTSQHDATSLKGQAMGVVIGDTCQGSPPW